MKEKGIPKVNSNVVPTTGGGSKSRKLTYAKTSKTTTCKDGKDRAVYKGNNGKNYVKRKSARTGKYDYKPISSTPR